MVPQVLHCRFMLNAMLYWPCTRMNPIHFCIHHVLSTHILNTLPLIYEWEMDSGQGKATATTGAGLASVARVHQAHAWT